MSGHPAPASGQGEQGADLFGPLMQAERLLAEIDALGLERHPEAFAAIDADLRRALQPPSRGD